MADSGSTLRQARATLWTSASSAESSTWPPCTRFTVKTQEMQFRPGRFSPVQCEWSLLYLPNTAAPPTCHGTEGQCSYRLRLKSGGLPESWTTHWTCRVTVIHFIGVLRYAHLESTLKMLFNIKSKDAFTPAVFGPDFPPVVKTPVDNGSHQTAALWSWSVPNWTNVWTVCSVKVCLTIVRTFRPNARSHGQQDQTEGEGLHRC